MSHDSEGLQILQEVLVALGGVSLAVDIGCGFSPKGGPIALIKEERKGDRIQWLLGVYPREIIGCDCIEYKLFKL